MLNGTELFDMIKNAAQRAPYHRCSRSCETAYCASGRPPGGYWARAVRLFARYGYRLVHGVLEEGCDGVTSGPEAAGCPRSTRIRSGLSPAREYAVLAHEFGHVVLAHPPGNWEEVWREYDERAARAMLRGEPFEENFDHEVPCELAALACAAAAGLPVHRVHQHYLNTRIRAYRRRPDEKCLWAAYLAASTFNEAMLEAA